MSDIINNDTSHGQAERWSKWLRRFVGAPDLKFLEIGSYEGQSAIWFLRNLLTHPTSTLLCVDTWHAGEDMPYVEGDRLLATFLDNIVQWRSHCGVMRGRSEDVLPKLDPQSFDFIYIDGSHTAASVLSDSVMAWRLLKVGGVVIWDDYLWELFDDPLRQPKLGVDSFLACYEGRYEVLAKEWQVAITKIKA